MEVTKEAFDLLRQIGMPAWTIVVIALSIILTMIYKNTSATSKAVNEMKQDLQGYTRSDICATKHIEIDRRLKALEEET